jgi:RNA polymerase sigma-70 factor (ECF subfamily)
MLIGNLPKFEKYCSQAAAPRYPDKLTRTLRIAMNTSLEAELRTIRPDMVRFAMLQLRDEAAAEDAVQEAMASALEGQKNFAGKSKLKTWIFSILKNKIVDIIRHRSREQITPVCIEEIPEESFDPLFDGDGFWQKDERPSHWGNPEQSLIDNQFWKIFEACLNFLPANTARVFMMREMLGFDTDEICKELSISTTNCWVVLHRARMSLRLCLQERWFDA